VDVSKAVVECTLAGAVDVRLVTYTVGVFRSSQSSARRSHTQTGRPCCDSGVVLLLSYGLDAVCVVASELGKGELLRINIDTRVDKANSVYMELHGRTSSTAIGDPVVLLLKVVGVNRTIVTEIRLAPETESVAA
jgi:hypothetical protein